VLDYLLIVFHLMRLWSIECGGETELQMMSKEGVVACFKILCELSSVETEVNCKSP